MPRLHFRFLSVFSPLASEETMEYSSNTIKPYVASLILNQVP